MTNGWKLKKKKKHTKRGKKRGRKLKCPCLHVFPKCHAPDSRPCYHPSLSAINCLIKEKSFVSQMYSVALVCTRVAFKSCFTGIRVFSNEAGCVSRLLGKHFFPLPRKHVCISLHVSLQWSLWWPEHLLIYHIRVVKTCAWSRIC